MNIAKIIGMVAKTKGLGTELMVSTRQAERLLGNLGAEAKGIKSIFGKIAQKHPNANFRLKVNNSEQGLLTLGGTMVEGPTTLANYKLFVSNLGTENAAVRAYANLGKNGEITYRGYSRAYGANKNSDYLYSLTRKGDITRYEGQLADAEHGIIEVKGNKKHPISGALADSHTFMSDLLAGKDVPAPAEFLKGMFSKGKAAEKAQKATAQAKGFDAEKFKDAFKIKDCSKEYKNKFNDELVKNFMGSNPKEAKIPKLKDLIKDINNNIT